jgi:hypothetical protein
MNLQTFFNEKALDERMYEVTAPGGTVNFIYTSAVVERILSTTGHERQQISSILLQLDVRNGDVHHFLAHLAQGLATDF